MMCLRSQKCGVGHVGREFERLCEPLQRGLEESRAKAGGGLGSAFISPAKLRGNGGSMEAV